MNALVYKSSGEPIGKFEIENVDELPQGLEKFLATGVRTPLHSYIEADGRAWTIIGLNPVNLKEGKVSRRFAYTQKTRHREVESGMQDVARRQMMAGLAWLAGGIVVTVGSYSIAANVPGGGHYFLATGAMVWGAIRFFTGLAGIVRK